MKEYKTCKSCSQRKPFSDFYKSSKGCKNGLMGLCKKCHYSSTKEWRKNNKDKIPAYMRKHGLKSRYNITEDQYQDMVKDQNNQCYICGNLPDPQGAFQNQKLHIDHCHETGKIRGLLCHLCNRGIGLFKERIDLIEKALHYLRTQG